MTEVYVKENSWLAYIAAKVLATKRVAIVFNRSIHLHNCSKKDFLTNKKWVLHELKHVAQYQQLGTIRFIISYLYESAAKGYQKNKFEIAARDAENDVELLTRYKILVP